MELFSITGNTTVTYPYPKKENINLTHPNIALYPYTIITMYKLMKKMISLKLICGLSL